MRQRQVVDLGSGQDTEGLRMTVHELTCVDPFFAHVALGLKTFEVRKNDRDFQVGDVLLLSRFATSGLTGERVHVDIVYVLEGAALAKGYCVLGIQNPVLVNKEKI
jgi:hypothetical protein